MKKFGFTLAEMVIAIAVVGVLAAASVPLVNSIIPDREKVQVLKAYKQLKSINQEIISNPSIYDPNDPIDPNNQQRQGLLNTDPPLGWRPTNEDLRNFINNNNGNNNNSKYSAILADYLKAEDYNYDNDNNNGSFTTPDGMLWIVEDEDNGIISITIDTKNIINNENNNADNTPNCSYGEQNCNSPDRFIFSVTATDGRVEGIDPLTRAYLANPYRLSDRKNDYIKAQEFVEDALEE